MVVDADLLKFGAAFYARRITQPQAVLGAIHWLPGATLPTAFVTVAPGGGARAPSIPLGSAV